MATTTEPPTRGLTRARRMLLWSIIAGVLMGPALILAVTSEVDWRASFVFAGAALIAAGVLFELAMWTLLNPLHRLIAGLAILGMVLLVWIEGAVGIFH